MSRSTRNTTSWGQIHKIWLKPVLVLAAATALFLGASFGYDWYFNYQAQGDVRLGPVELLFNYDMETLQNVLGNLAQTVVAVVGIVITVVAIVVQLAATRYTPRVTELFLKERTNFIVLGFFVVSCVSAIWVSLAVGNGFLPRVSVAVSVISVTLSLLLMVPYFAFVFNFLEPENVVGTIQDNAIKAASFPGSDTPKAQVVALAAVEQLADIAVAAVASQDKLISARAVDGMRILLVSYTSAKTKLPDAWFTPCGRICEDPDFVAMHPEALDDLIRDKTWLEWKVLRQYQAIFSESLKDNPDMNLLIAINTRYLGEAALAHRSQSVVLLVIKFFNTFLRATLNKKQVRTAYNLMNQYRQLVEAIVLDGQADLASEIASYFRYYGQTANGMGLSFVTETIAYDVASLCELTFREKSGAHDALLAALLELDKEAESEDQEAALRGVRKAQIRLAAFYLLSGNEANARKIHADMKDERPERLISIREELQRIISKDFWEVIDRGANFDFMEDNRKEQLDTFFLWFTWSARTIRPQQPAIATPESGRFRAADYKG
jgi:hypothetical protein